MNPIAFAMRHPITMAMLVVVLLGAGGLAIFKMRVDIFPEFDLPQIYIVQNYNGFSPAQMEALIVNQIELNLQYVDGIKNVESQSIQQIALIKVSFYPGTNMAGAMAAVVAQVNRAEAYMPAGVLPPQIMRMDAGSVPVGYLVLTSKSTSLGMMADLAEQRIRPLVQLLVPGTVGTAPFGSNIRSIIVTVDPDRLRSYNLTPRDVTEAVMSGNVVIPAGNIYIKDQMPMMPTNAMVNDIQQLGTIPLRRGRNLYIKDVATIADSTDINYGYGMVDGKRSVYIPIVKKNTASTLTVVSDIHKGMERFRGASEGVEIRYEFDESPTVVEAIRSVATEGAIGAGLTGLTVLIFLRDWRSVIVVVFNIPLALLGSMFALYITKNTTNIMTLGGLALAIGILVDEATVEVENIHAQMERVGTIPRAVRLGNSITAVPRLLAMLCILSVFIPAFIMAEPVRSLFVPLSLAVGFAMISSYLLSSTLVPVLATWLLKGPKELKDKEQGDHKDEKKIDQRADQKHQGFFGRMYQRTMSLWPLNKLHRHPEKEEEQPRHEEPYVQEHDVQPRGERHQEHNPDESDGQKQGGEHGALAASASGSESEEGLHKGFFGRIQRVFIGFVRFSIGWRWIVVPAYLAGCMFILVVVGLQLGRELFPVVDQGQFVLRYHMPPGTTYELTRAAWVQCLHEIEDIAGAGNVDISMGFAGQQAPDFAMNNMILFMSGPEDGQVRVALRDGCDVHVPELQDKLRQELPKRLKPWLSSILRKEGYTDADAKTRADQLRIGFEPGNIVSQVMSFGSPTPIEIVVSSPNLSDARAYVEKVMGELKSNQFLRDLQIHQSLDYPIVDVRIDRQKANLSGVTTNDVGRSVLVATSSSRMLDRNYWIDTKLGASYQVQVQTPIQRMTSEDQIRTIPVEQVTPGLNLLVRDVAHVAKGFMPGEYDHTAMQRYLSITANVEGEDIGRAAKQIDEAVKGAGKLPRGLHVESRGQVAPMNEMFLSLAIGLAVAVFVILVLLTAYFQSPHLALTSIGAVPGVLSGVVLILYFTNTTLNIESFMGTIMCVGVSVSNSVMLVTFMSMDWEKGLSIRDSAIRGAGERLRPILMTACAMTIGMVPMSLGLESGSKMEAPLGRAVIGGLVMSTFATLLILPSIYTLIMGDRKFAHPSIDPNDPESRYFDGGEEANPGTEEKKQEPSPKNGRTQGDGRREADNPEQPQPNEGVHL